MIHIIFLPREPRGKIIAIAAQITIHSRSEIYHTHVSGLWILLGRNFFYCVPRSCSIGSSIMSNIRYQRSEEVRWLFSHISRTICVVSVTCWVFSSSAICSSLFSSDELLKICPSRGSDTLNTIAKSMCAIVLHWRVKQGAKRENHTSSSPSRACFATSAYLIIIR